VVPHPPHLRSGEMDHTRRAQTDTCLLTSDAKEAPKSEQSIGRFDRLLADLRAVHETELEALRRQLADPFLRGAPPAPRLGAQGKADTVLENTAMGGKVASCNELAYMSVATDPDSESRCSPATKAARVAGSEASDMEEENAIMPPAPRVLNPPPPQPPSGTTTEGDSSISPTLQASGLSISKNVHVSIGIPGPGRVQEGLSGEPDEKKPEKEEETVEYPPLDMVSNDESFIMGRVHSTTPTFQNKPSRGESDSYTLPRTASRSLTPCKDYILHTIWRSELSRCLERKVSFSRRSSGIIQTSQMHSKESLIVRSSHPLQRLGLHPSSLKRLAWDLMSMSLLAYDIMVIPFVSAFEPSQTGFLLGMTWGTLLFWTCDMPLSMISGFQRGKLTVLAPRETFLHYLKTWFVLDMLIIFLDWTALLLDGNADEDGVASDSGGSVTRLGRTLRTLRFIRTLRLLRVLKLKKIVQAIQDSINTEAISIIFGIFKIILCLIVANHIVACGWYAIAYQFEDQGMSWVVQAGMERRSLTYRYTTSLHWSLTQFTPASMEVVPQTTGERIYTVVVILFAMVAFSSFVSILTASMAQLQRMSSNESRQFWLLRRYLKDWNVRRKVGIRVQRYLEYAYQKQKGKVQEHEVKLLALLSEPLRLELKHETFSHYLAGHPLFYLCSEQARVFGKALSATSLAQGDLIFACGEKAKKVTFLTGGCLEYTLGDKVDCNGKTCSTAGGRDYMFEGMWISEAVLWTEWHHLGDLQAMTECQVITVESKQFGEAVQVNAPMWMAVRKYAERFIDALNGIDLEDLTDLTHQLFSPHDAIEPDDFAIQRDRERVDHATETRFSKVVKLLGTAVFSRKSSDLERENTERSLFSPPNSPRLAYPPSYPWAASKVVPTVS